MAHALELAPDHDGVRLAYAETLFRQQKAAEAIPHIEQLLAALCGHCFAGGGGLTVIFAVAVFAVVVFVLVLAIGIVIMAAVAYVILKDWDVRLKAEGQDLRSIALGLMEKLKVLQDGRAVVIVPPAIQGIGNAGGFQMQIEQKDGSFDYAKLQAITDTMVRNAGTQSALSNVVTTFRSGAPHVRIEVDRVKAESLRVPVGDVFTTLSSYMGSAFVNRFNKFGLTLMVFLQAEAEYRTKAEDIVIEDLAVNPISRQAYLAVSRGRGPEAVPLLVRIKADGQAELVSLDQVKFSRAALPDAPAWSEIRDKRRELRR